MSANNQSYDELCYENDEINRKWAEDNERNGDICYEQEEQIKELKEENDEYKLRDENTTTYKELEKDNEKLKEECGAMDIVEKLNKEFDELQTENQEFVEEIEYKTETIKELKLELEIVCRFSDYQRHNSNVLTTALWFRDNVDWLIEKGIITRDCSDFHTQVDELAEQDIDITDKLAAITISIEDEFCHYVRENITSSYF